MMRNTVAGSGLKRALAMDEKPRSAGLFLVKGASALLRAGHTRGSSRSWPAEKAVSPSRNSFVERTSWMLRRLDPDEGLRNRVRGKK